MSSIKKILGLALIVNANFALAVSAPISDLLENDSVHAVQGLQNESNIARIERLLANSSQQQIQIRMDMDSMIQEINNLRGQIEHNTYEMEKMLARQRELFISLEKIADKTTTKSTSSNATINVEQIDKLEQEAYQKAVNLILKNRDYLAAISAFKAFMQQYPNSKYIANSNYWLGQIAFAAKKDDEAREYFLLVIDEVNFNKGADVLSKLGDLELRNSNTVVAKQYYLDLITKYPESTSAQLAQKKLQELEN